MIVINTKLKGDPFLSFFQDCVKCLSEFACNQLHLDIAMEAIHLIRKCAKFVNEHIELFTDNTVEGRKTKSRRGFPVVFVK